MINNLKLLLLLNDVARNLPRKTVAFFDGSLPLRDVPNTNAERFVSENPDMRSVQGWLIIGACIFRKHSVIGDETGRFFEITPLADDLPFAPHYPKIGVYDRMPEEIFLLLPKADD